MDAPYWNPPPHTGGARPLYPAYGEYRWSKSTQFSLLLHSMRDLHFRIELQILHGRFTDQADLFMKTLDMTFLPPNGVFRGHPGEPSSTGGAFRERFTFVTLFDGTGKFALPLNMPRVAPIPVHYPDKDYMQPHMQDNYGAVLEYARRNMTSTVLLDPLEGIYKAMYTEDEYWHSSLTLVPMHFLPFFSHCTGGVRIGVEPSGAVGSRNYQKDAETPFRIGHEDALGGAPIRRRGSRVQCLCNNVLSYKESCSGVNGQEDCVPVLDATSPNGEDPVREIFLASKQYPALEAGSTEQYFLSTRKDPADQFGEVPDFFVSNECQTCADAGYPSGGPYPAVNTDPQTGQVRRIDGWDSRVPTFYVIEHPEACNIVPPAETVAIGEWDFLYTARYSDACDYVMQCMYEENTLLAPGKPFWFDPMQDDTLFWISFKPLHVDAIAQGFCFPGPKHAHRTASNQPIEHLLSCMHWP